MGISTVLRQVYTSPARRAAGAVDMDMATPKPGLKRPWQTADLKRSVWTQHALPSSSVPLPGDLSRSVPYHDLLGSGQRCAADAVVVGAATL